MNGELFDRTSQIESSTLEAHAHVVAIMKPLQSRILVYCSHGNHKETQINDALTKGYTLEVRYNLQAWNEPKARKLENDLLDMYDYAWNERRNGGNLGIRLLPN